MSREIPIRFRFHLHSMRTKGIYSASTEHSRFLTNNGTPLFLKSKQNITIFSDTTELSQHSASYRLDTSDNHEVEKEKILSSTKILKDVNFHVISILRVRLCCVATNYRPIELPARISTSDNKL